jgi:hypothetical protein
MLTSISTKNRADACPGSTPKGKRGCEIPINNELLPVHLKLKAGSKSGHVVEKTNDKPQNRVRRLR